MKNLKFPTAIIKAMLHSVKLLQLIVIIGLAMTYSLPLYAVGFNLLTIPNGEHKSLSVGVWYPSDTEPSNTTDSRFDQKLAMNGGLSVKNASLVVLSHGYGGWMGSHADIALALAKEGFVVAAPSHTGNTFKDMSAPLNKWLMSRPKNVSLIIDFLNKEWSHRSVLQNSKVGVFGFSAGGQTALSLIGAVPNLLTAKAHCESASKEFVCSEGMIKEMLATDMDKLPNSAWGADHRIKAAVIAAPGLGIAYNKQSLENVNVPVQLWAGLLDDRVPHESNTKPIANLLGGLSENHWVENAGHFSFLIQSCTKKLKKYDPQTWAFLCVDKEGFDRKEFHSSMNKKIAKFFKAKL